MSRKASSGKDLGFSQEHKNSYESHAAHLNKYGMVSSVKTNTCHSKINRLFNHCIHSHGHGCKYLVLAQHLDFLKKLIFSTQKLLSVSNTSSFVPMLTSYFYVKF